MANGQNRHGLQQYIADMVALESKIEEALDQMSREIKEHAEAAAAFSRFHTMVKGQHEALRARLLSIGGSDLGTAKTIPPLPFGTSVRGEERAQAVSKALQAIYTLFNHAAFGYDILHVIAHRFYDSTGDGNTADLAEKHLRSYAEAAQGVNQLISDVVVWELDKDGHECRCLCPSCSLGVCLCAPHGTVTVNNAWREAIPADAQQGVHGIMVRTPKANSAAARAGLRSGDIVIGVDGQEIQNESKSSLKNLQDTISKHKPGEEIRLRVLRASGDIQDISVTRS